MPRVSFNYLGQFDTADLRDATSGQLQEDSASVMQRQHFWHITKDKGGVSMHQANQDYNIININGFVINNRLQFIIAGRLDVEAADRISEFFKRKLEEIITHCEDKKNTEYMISDYSDFEPYVVFNGKIKGNENRIFMFPPGSGGAESYFNNLVPRLQNKNLVLFNNFFDFLAKKFALNSIQELSFEQLAQLYLPYIKSIQSEGPYNLFGWSFGGTLAFEIGRQLSNDGYVVNNIIMIDSAFHYKKALQHKNTLAYELGDINSKYIFSEKIMMKDVNITLFKATEFEGLGDTYPEYLDICKYYVQNTMSNHLDDILKKADFQVYNMSCNHMEWMNKDSVHNEICKKLMTL